MMHTACMCLSRDASMCHVMSVFTYLRYTHTELIRAAAGVVDWCDVLMWGIHTTLLTCMRISIMFCCYINMTFASPPCLSFFHLGLLAMIGFTQLFVVLCIVLISYIYRVFLYTCIFV